MIVPNLTTRMTVTLLFITSINCATAAAQVDFVRDIRPIFQEHCYRCHGPERQKSGLRLDVKSAALKGGEYHRPNLVPGNQDQSALFRFVSGADEEVTMPPKGPSLSAEDVNQIKSWIQQGAVWPDGVDKVKLDDPRDHWSFQPLDRPKPPTVRNASWPRNEIDHFILQRLEQSGLAPNPEADKVTWLRRVTFDLIGLPPTPESLAAFLADESAEARAKVVEKLLASERHGERWAQHWLDLVRYADTHGFEVNTPRPHAWPYRDYVIAAFNNDTPYDQFIREQLAGDQFGKQEATGFLVTAAALLPGQIGKDDASKRLARQDELGEIMNNVGEAFLGLSIGCARCHDHKFDPISAVDYYELQAFFAGVAYGDVSVPNLEAERDETDHRARLTGIEKRITPLFPLVSAATHRSSVSAVANVERFAPVKTKRVRLTITSTINQNKREPCIDELEIFDTQGRNVALASAGGKASASGSRRNPNRHDLAYANDGVYGNSRSWMGNRKGEGWLQIDLPVETEIERIVWGRDRQKKFGDRLADGYRIECTDAKGGWRLLCDSTGREPFDPKLVKRDPFNSRTLNPNQTEEIEQLLKKRTATYRLLGQIVGNGRLVFSGKFRKPEPQFFLRRGDPEQPKQEVQPAVFPFLRAEARPAKPATESQRRKAVANWIASPRNPLTARVMVNRVWQWHFGTGLVDTPNDFGNAGAEPSHPELLDWLADEFIRSGWSIKRLHRLIVLSATYRQSSQIHEAGLKADAGARLLWRFPSRRLAGEAIRDSMLAVSGRLNLKTGGPGFDLFKSRGGLSGFPPIETFSSEGRRRLIYAHKIRMEREIVFGAFDCPDAGQSAPMRKRSTTPIQALNLFNSRFSADESKSLAEHLRQGEENDLPTQVRKLWLLAFSRPPEKALQTEAIRLAEEHGLESLCRAVFNSNEFLFLP